MAQVGFRAVSNTHTYVQGGLDVWTNTVSGGTQVDIYLYFRRTNNYSGATSSSNVSGTITIDGTSYSGTFAPNLPGSSQNVWRGWYLHTSKVINAEKDITISWSTRDNVSSYFSGSGSATIHVSPPTTPPTGGYATTTSIGQNSITATVGVSSFGVPNTNAALELKVLQSPYTASGMPARQETGLANGQSATVSNSSDMYGSPSFNITPNTTYYLGVYATNGVELTRFNIRSFNTAPTTPTFSVVSTSQTAATISYSFPAGGSVHKKLDYKIGNGSWVWVADFYDGNAKSGSFSVSGLTPGTTYRITPGLFNDTASTSGSTISFTTQAAPVLYSKYYGSVNGKAKKVVKCYGSVNGKAKKIVKYYGSVNGKAKLFFES